LLGFCFIYVLNEFFFEMTSAQATIEIILKCLW
jgi:hypothetical protein